MNSRHDLNMMQLITVYNNKKQAKLSKIYPLFLHKDKNLHKKQIDHSNKTSTNDISTITSTTDKLSNNQTFDSHSSSSKTSSINTKSIISSSTLIDPSSSFCTDPVLLNHISSQSFQVPESFEILLPSYRQDTTEITKMQATTTHILNIEPNNKDISIKEINHVNNNNNNINNTNDEKNEKKTKLSINSSIFIPKALSTQKQLQSKSTSTSPENI